MQIPDFLQALWNLIESFLDLVLSGENIGHFQSVIQWTAIVLSALAGTYAARRLGMDFFGALAIAIVFCVGGGTTRDVLLGRHPIFWLASPTYIATVFVISLFGQLLQRDIAKKPGLVAGIARPVESLADELSPIFLVVDSLALGLWAYLGVYYALSSQVPPIITPVLGVITAVFGGVLRDVFFARVPRQFMPGQVYASAAAIGSFVYLFFWWIGQGDAIGFIACVAVTFTIRMLVVRYNITTS